MVWAIRGTSLEALNSTTEYRTAAESSSSPFATHGVCGASVDLHICFCFFEDLDVRIKPVLVSGMVVYLGIISLVQLERA